MSLFWCAFISESMIGDVNLFLNENHSAELEIMIAGKKLFNPLTAKLFNLNFYPLEVVSR